MQKKPLLCQKSPTFSLKSPTFSSKSPVLCQDSQDSLTSPLLYRRSPLLYQKSPTFSLKSPWLCQDFSLTVKRDSQDSRVKSQESGECRALLASKKASLASWVSSQEFWDSHDVSLSVKRDFQDSRAKIQESGVLSLPWQTDSLGNEVLGGLSCEGGPWWSKRPSLESLLTREAEDSLL